MIDRIQEPASTERVSHEWGTTSLPTLPDMPSRLVLEERSGKLSLEERMAQAHAQAIQIPMATCSLKQMQRDRFALKEGDLAIGTVPFVLHAMTRLGMDLPEHQPYPAELTPWLHRTIGLEPTLASALARVEQGQRLFIKPARGWKRFTGFVVEHGHDIRFLGASRRMPVWVSTPIDIVSEWRAYVAHGEVLALEFATYGGDPQTKPDLATIHAALNALRSRPDVAAGFVIDFGVLRSGVTVLIEMNDGFSFGAYGSLTPHALFEVSWARWRQLLASRRRKPD